jgi:hypothetical protein
VGSNRHGSRGSRSGSKAATSSVTDRTGDPGRANPSDAAMAPNTAVGPADQEVVATGTGQPSSAWAASTFDQRSGVTDAGCVVARKSRSSASSTSGCSNGRKWPAPSMISSRLAGSSS